ncbi:MAG: hypothetical protein RIS47_1504 [Bacteroidota bacterium]|jgi:flavodoxin I
MDKIGVFYGPEKGSTEKVAQMIVELLGTQVAEVHSIEKATPEDLLAYKTLILGVATVGRDTWETEHGQRGWDVFLPKLSAETSFEGIKVAVYGLGNHLLYPTMFCDAMGTLAIDMRNRKATLCGSVETDTYTFEDSAAIENGLFLGLPLDEDVEPELTKSRLVTWLENLAWV